MTPPLKQMFIKVSIKISVYSPVEGLTNLMIFFCSHFLLAMTGGAGEGTRGGESRGA